MGANIEIGASGTSSIDENDQFQSIPEYTLGDVGGNSPLEYFSLLFSNDMLEHIVTQTNLSADQYIASHDLGPHSRVRRWSKAVHDLSELQRFLAIIIIIKGLVRYPQIESHWSTLWPYSNAQFSTVSVCIIQQHVNYCTITPTYMYTRKLYTYTMQTNRHTHTNTRTNRHKHINDSSLYRKKGEPGHDPLHKLRPFLEPLVADFQENYTLSKEVCIDESMIGFKGRLSFIQYMPKKPTKWGIQAFVLADSQNGCMYNWHLSTGNYHHQFPMLFPHPPQLLYCTHH